MRILMFFALLPATAILVGCASTESIVVSNRSNPGSIEEGVVYSLPKQLVKVTYTRKAIDSSEAAKEKKKAEETVEVTTKALKTKKKEEKDLITLIKNIDPQAANKVQLEAKLNLDLTKIKAEKLLLTKQLTENKKTLSAASFAYAQSLQSDKAFSEQLKITPESPIADNKNTFYAKVQHQGMYSDTLELKTKNGLLDGAIGHSEDKTGEIIVSLAGSLSGLIQPAFLGTSGQKLFSLPIPSPAAKCQKKEAVSVSQVIDPSEQSDKDALNKQLSDGCIEIDIEPPLTAQVNVLNNKQKAKGLLYRQPGTFSFNVQNVDDHSVMQTIRLSLAQGGQVGIISMPKGNFSKNEYDVAFSNGILTKNKVIQPSETLGVVMIVPNALREIFAIPTELIQLKVNYSSSEKELIEFKKAMLEAQVEIEKKQLELEGIAASEGAD